MRKQISKQVASYWCASRKVTFEGSDKQDIYNLLGRAEALIAVLAAKIGHEEAALTVGEGHGDE